LDARERLQLFCLAEDIEEKIQKKMNSREPDHILGCFVSGPARYHDDAQNTREVLDKKGEIFRSYVWGEFGITDLLKTLERSKYGNDLKLILFQFYLLPLLEELAHLKEIERYRPKERAVGIPIIIHDENFFNRSDYDRRSFLRNSILEKLDLLAIVVKRNKLDTNIELLKSDVGRVLS
jgi:hypothetical protein